MCIKVWYILEVKIDGAWVPENASTDKETVKRWRKHRKHEQTRIKKVKGRG